MTAGIALLYARVSTQMQATDGMSLDAQERELRAAATFAGYTEMELVREEGRSGKSIKGRPALRGALERLDNGTASALIVTRVDRLARSTKDFLNIIDRANQKGWRLVMLDLNLDTSTYQGRFVVTIMSALAEMERSIISERQKSVHKYRRETGQNWGVDLGPKSKISDEAIKIITELRDKGVSYHETARQLNAQNVPTALGGKWHGSTIRKTLNFLKADKIGEGPDSSGPQDSCLSPKYTVNPCLYYIPTPCTLASFVTSFLLFFYRSKRTYICRQIISFFIYKSQVMKTFRLLDFFHRRQCSTNWWQFSCLLVVFYVLHYGKI